jgi:hypothetical protein
MNMDKTYLTIASLFIIIITLFTTPPAYGGTKLHIQKPYGLILVSTGADNAGSAAQFIYQVTDAAGNPIAHNLLTGIAPNEQVTRGGGQGLDDVTHADVWDDLNNSAGPSQPFNVTIDANGQFNDTPVGYKALYLVDIWMTLDTAHSVTFTSKYTHTYSFTDNNNNTYTFPAFAQTVAQQVANTGDIIVTYVSSSSN